MLPTTRRAFTIASRASSSLRSLSPSPCFTVGPSSDLFHPPLPLRTFSTAATPSAQAFSKAKANAKKQDQADKAERRRQVRQIRKAKAERKVELAKVSKRNKVVEVLDKRKLGIAMTEGLPPVSEDDLKAMYRGLLEAKPEELAQLTLPTPDPLPALQDPLAGAHDREGRLKELEGRIDRFDQEEDFLEEKDEEGVVLENIAEGPTTISEGPSLADRLLQRARAASGSQEQTQPLPLKFQGATTFSDDLDGEPLHRRLLAKLEGFVPSEEAKLAEDDRQLMIPTGVATVSEWKDVILMAASEGDAESVQKGFHLLKKSIDVMDASLITETMAIFASKGEARNALSLASFAAQNSLPMSTMTHHHLLSSILPAHAELAIRHIHSLESAGYTPLMETYTLLISTLLSPSSPPHLVSRGWDLFAHTRLVSHPVPSVELYTTMIAACARGLHPSPERAVDLFTEMTDDHGLPPSTETFNALIRACARRGKQEDYFEALRFMRRMLDDNVPPTRQTFHAILEGAKKLGDLPRARWMLVKMVEVGGAAAPDASTLGLIFLTYARFVPQTRISGERDARKSGSGGSPASRRRDELIHVEGQRSGEETSNPERPLLGDEASGILSILGEQSINYPGPLPQTTEALLAEASTLMSQCVDSRLLASPISQALFDSAPLPSPQQTIFPSVRPTTFLVNSYLTFLAAHAPLSVMIDFFDNSFQLLGVEKNRHSFEVVMKRCEKAKNRVQGLEIAKSVFNQWQQWDGGVKEDPGESGDGNDPRASNQDGVQSLQPWGKKSGSNISAMYASMIHTLARGYRDNEGLALLQSFITTYPPSYLISQSQSFSNSILSLPEQPSGIRLSSPLYPETSGAATVDRAPHLRFEDLKLLFQKLKEIEDNQGLKVVTGVVKAYDKALKEAREMEVGRIVAGSRPKKTESKASNF
ncbi:hypothetical protein T439DRAFT_377023 [Meredithblackwellia eburnea MCA 4105]